MIKSLFSIVIAFSFTTMLHASDRGGGNASSGKDTTKSALPGTEVFLYDLSTEGDQIALTNPKNISNHAGYDNQPAFSLEGRFVYYVSARELQTDIFRYDCLADKTERMTESPESEYSPKMLYDKEHFSVVMVEKDSMQRLWMFGLDGQKPELINKKINKVGYYCWMGTNNFAYFHIGEKINSLKTASFQAKVPRDVKDHIGRSMHRIPGVSYISYVYKKSETLWYIAKMNIYSDETSNIVATMEGVEDHAWTPDGTLIAAKGTTIYKLKPGIDTDWIKVVTLAPAVGSEITRIAIDPRGKRIAIVLNEPSEEEPDDK